MDPTFYEDNASAAVMHHPPALVHDLKASLTLNIASTPSPMSTSSNAIPLRLTSPDFEEIIVHQETKMTSTPTAILFPKLVTKEQEEYAKGFLQALEKLHRSNGQPCIISPENSSSSRLSTESSQDISSALNATSSLVNSSSSTEGVVVNQPVASDHGLSVPALPLSEMPQTVPSSVYVALPISPVDSRLEMKRARNRLAAQKCRVRKIERIAELSERVRELKMQNMRLAQTSYDLQNQMEAIKRQLMLHVASGCQITM